jgi:ATP/maltotriose-dependent transcriptional regulator MalT
VVVADLERARAAAAGAQWSAAYSTLTAVDLASPLGAEDLEVLATAAYLLGRREHSLDALRRAFQLFSVSERPLRAVRCAFWLVFHLMNQGDLGQANGWLARANRLLAEQPQKCVERGYLLLPQAIQSIFAGDFATTRTLGGEAAALGRRFHDADLVALALNVEGRALIYDGEPVRGMALLDEAMVGVVAGELSPAIAGTVYCSVIEACHEIAELRRAHEWTSALTNWCDRQHGIVTFTGQCLVHRAEIMRLHGEWPQAVQEAQQACERFAAAADQYAVGAAFYQQAEVFRVCGDFSAAERAYQQARQAGLEPHPGLALLRLAQGNTDAAQAAIRRALVETHQKPNRVRLLPACVEIMLAAGDLDAARAAAAELAQLADLYQTQAVRAMADQASGAVLLAGGDASGAALALMRAWHAWRDLQAPYEAACVRVRIGLARAALGDAEAAASEFDSARSIFAQLGALPDVQRVNELSSPSTAPLSFGLTARELEVLRLLVTGRTNGAIAEDLVLSAKTVDRHVSNIFDKLGVSSRTAATAFAYEHHLVDPTA